MSDQSEHTRQLHAWLASFEAALSRGDADAAAALFDGAECYWRDLIAFTWNIATLDGRPAIEAMLRSQVPAVLPVTLAAEGDAVAGAGDMIEGWFDFETIAARGKGHVRLRDGKAWTLLTAMQSLKGFEEPAGRRRSDGIEHKAVKGRKSWLEERMEQERRFGTDIQPHCLIIGGSQAGLALAARMKRLGVPALIVDALEKPGDAWRRRYKSLCLHDPVWIDHLPYLPFPDHWPVYTAKDKMGDWLESYCRIMELDFWGATLCRNARFDEGSGRWHVEVERAGATYVLTPKELVLATGLSGIPNRPVFRGSESFEGEQLHSSDYEDGSRFAGKTCVVVGANNSAHDICADLWANDADVTMIQRSATTVVKAAALKRLSERGPFSEDGIAAGIDTDRADLIMASLPFRPKEVIDRENCKRIQAEDADFYDRLRATGFLLDFGEDETAIAGKYPRRASGYYIDVGASDLIAEGEIKVHSGVEVAAIRPRSMLLSDGADLPADVIIYATGYGPMDGWAEMLISKAVAERVGRCWGLGSDTAGDPGPWEGELRNMWKPTAQPGLWFHGGNLAQSRFHSLHLALQIKARMEGVPTPVYQPAPIERAPLDLKKKPALAPAEC
jgi:putative flavoprotein involved in K+ transport